jgi:hypothetical protein
MQGDREAGGRGRGGQRTRQGDRGRKGGKLVGRHAGR